MGDSVTDGRVCADVSYRSDSAGSGEPGFGISAFAQIPKH